MRALHLQPSNPLRIIWDMGTLALFVMTLLTGCLAAIPAGPIQVEVAKRAVHGHLTTALVVIATTALVDISYGAIALFGIAPAFHNMPGAPIFSLTGGLALIVVGIITTRKDTATWKPRKRTAALTAAVLSTTNPVMILWWLAFAKTFHDMGLYGELTTATAVTMLTAGTLGMASYLTVLAVALHNAKRFISTQTIEKINLCSGCFLVILGVYFIVTSLRQL